jgi:hypothetical protein
MSTCARSHPCLHMTIRESVWSAAQSQFSAFRRNFRVIRESIFYRGDAGKWFSCPQRTGEKPALSPLLMTTILLDIRMEWSDLLC